MKILLRLFFQFFLTVILFPQTNLEHDTREILVVHSYHQGLEWTDSISAGIKSVLNKDAGKYNITFEYLDTKRNPGEEFLSRLIDFEKQKLHLSETKFDIIISSDNDALQFMVEAGDDLFPGIPVVFCGVNNFSPALLMDKNNITGIKEAVDYKGTLDVMSKLHPDRNKILFILDRTSTGNKIKNEIDTLLRNYKTRFEFEYYRELIPIEIRKRIQNLGDDYLIYLLAFNSDNKGNFIDYTEAIEMIYSHSKVPIYGSWDFFFGKGILGGMITSGFAQGEQAAEYVIKILNGESPDSLDITDDGTNRYMFDYAELEKFNIDLSLLPHDSVTINTPLTFHQKYKEIIKILILVLGGFSVVFLVYSRIQRKKKKDLIIMNELLDQKVRKQTEALLEKNRKLEMALSDVKILSGLLPICSNCKKIRDDRGYWNQIEFYFTKHTHLDFSHGICPDCLEKLYPDIKKRRDK